MDNDMSEEFTRTQRIKAALTNGSGTVSYRTFVSTLAICLVAVATGSWAVLAQHSSTPHPVTTDRIDAAKSEVTHAVERSEERLQEQIREQRTEQRATDAKIDQILHLMIQRANAESPGRSP
jgi:hypothetical protein